jgi:mono/diheme cytochrome c family protein
MPSQARDISKKQAGRAADWACSWPVLPGLLCLLASFALVACASPRAEAFNPTPIPTLAPVTVVPESVEAQSTPELVVESFPAGLPSAANGQVLYNEHCAGCHGVDGNGQVPNARDFGDVDYMRGESPLSLYLAITEGVSDIEQSGDQMPAFGDQLSSDERWDLAYYVGRFATSDERLAIGKQVYTSFCQECHGEDGRSQILNAADLSDQRFIAALSPSDLYLSITRGRGSMPAWQARLSQDERWMVEEYLRTFTYDPTLPESVSAGGEAEQGGEEEEQSLCDAAFLAKTNPFEWSDTTAIAAGEAIYARECADCHGDDGTGKIAGTPDFTNPAASAHLLEEPAEHLCVVTEGENRMPSFKDMLTETEMWQALTFIATLGE